MQRQFSVARQRINHFLLFKHIQRIEGSMSPSSAFMWYPGSDCIWGRDGQGCGSVPSTASACTKGLLPALANLLDLWSLWSYACVCPLAWLFRDRSCVFPLCWRWLLFSSSSCSNFLSPFSALWEAFVVCFQPAASLFLWLIPKSCKLRKSFHSISSVKPEECNSVTVQQTVPHWFSSFLWLTCKWIDPLQSSLVCFFTNWY